MALEARTRENINPSVPQLPDTGNASDSSEPSTPSIHPATRHSDELSQLEGNIPHLPSSSIRSRALSSASSTSSSPVRRKPLPLSASPLATRYSSGDHLTSTLELPEQNFVRPYSVDSPTLYDFPPVPSNPYSPAARFSTQQTITRYVCSFTKPICFSIMY